MKCDKCGGIMVYERFLSQEVEDFSGWGCVTEEKERKIRTNPAARVTDLLKEVFGK